MDGRNVLYRQRNGYESGGGFFLWVNAKLAEGDTAAQMLLLYGYINVDTDFEQTPTNKLDILPNSAICV